MQNPLISLYSILEALNIDTACTALLKQVDANGRLTQYSNPETVYRAIRTVGQTLNVLQEANQLAEELEERINIINHKLKYIAAESKPKVTVLNEVLPAQVADNKYVGNLVAIAGGIIHASTAVGELNPDIIIIVNDQPVSQLLEKLPEALSTHEWLKTNAIKNNNIYIIQHSGYLRQPGVNIADDAEILAEILHPKHFIFGRDKDVWMKFNWQ